MINIKKVAHQIKFDGMYNTVYIEVQDELKNEDPTVQEIEELLEKNDYFVWEYKELNRYGELSSVHAKKLEIKDSDISDAKSLKENLNKNTQKMRDLEMFEVDSKNSAYSIWIGSVGVMVIFMVHNIVALFSELYTTHGNMVYLSFALILALTYWSYKKAKQNHESKHANYKLIHAKTRNMIVEGLNKNYFSYEEFYEGISNDQQS